MQEMSAEFIRDFEGIENQETFFTPAEKSLLVYSCIIGITTRAVCSSFGVCCLTRECRRPKMTGVY